MLLQQYSVIFQLPPSNTQYTTADDSLSSILRWQDCTSYGLILVSSKETESSGIFYCLQQFCLVALPLLRCYICSSQIKLVNQLAKLSNSVKVNVGAELFFTLVKDNDHYCSGTEKGLTFLQSKAAWLTYSFIGYLRKPVPVRGMLKPKVLATKQTSCNMRLNKFFISNMVK